MTDIGFILGALVATRLLSGLFLWLTKSWDGGVRRLAVVHFVSLITAGLIGGTTLSADGNFAGVNAVGLYFIPQIIWFVFDIYCFREEKDKLQKIVMVTFGSMALLTIAIIILMEALGTSKSDMFEAVQGALDEPNTQISNINKKTAAILSSGLKIPYVIDDETTLIEITANENSVTAVIEKPSDQYELFEEEKVFWESYFCNNSQFLQLLTEGANISFLYVNPKGAKLDGHSITIADCRD